MGRRREQRNSLGLCGDGDDVAIVESVERVFGIRFTPSEEAQLRNAGQLCDLVLAKLPGRGSGSRGCLTAGAFYRLRAALRRMGATGRIKPESPLADMRGREPVRRFWRRLERETGLKLPGPFVGELGFWILFLNLLFLPLGPALAAIFETPAFLLLMLLVIPGLASAGMLFLVVPHGLSTVGGLARGVAHENFRTLADEGRGYRPRDVWNTLDYLLRAETGTTQPIDRETAFFDRDAR